MRPYTDHPFLDKIGGQDLSAYIDCIIAHQDLEGLLVNPSLMKTAEHPTGNVEPIPTSPLVPSSSSLNNKRLPENSWANNLDSERLLLIQVRIIVLSFLSIVKLMSQLIFLLSFSKQRVQMAQVLLLAVLLQPKYYNLIQVTVIMTRELCQLKHPTCTTNINFNLHPFLKWKYRIVGPCALLAHVLLIPNICSTIT